MRLPRFPLFALMASVALAARAELTYVLYDLDNPGAAPEPVQVTPEALKGETYRQPNKMLFVHDSTLDVPYYMGVYEVTKGQAERFGWKAPQGNYPANAAYAFRGNQFAYDTEAWRKHPLLQIPLAEQWLRYAEAPETPCNIPNGLSGMYGNTHTPAVWLTEQEQGHVSQHGLLDAYGNVAEYATDGRYYGGYASNSSNHALQHYQREPGQALTANTILNDTSIGTEGSRQGVRLVYVPPAEKEYTAKVMLGKATVATRQVKKDALVTFEWPKPAAGHRRIARTVTPEGLAVEDSQTLNATSFRMPAEDVTLAFEQKAVVTVAVAAEQEGGRVAFARQEPPASFDTLPADEAYVGETLTLTATPDPSWQVKEWRDGAGEVIPEAGASAQWAFVIPADAAPGSALTFTAVFERPTYEVAVTLNGASVEGWPQRFAAGESVTVEPPPTAEGTRLSNVAASGVEGQPTLTEPFTFAMPANDVAVAYQAAGYVNVRAEGGTANPAQPLIGGTVTLTASAPKYKTFKQWTGPATSEDSPFTYTIPADATPGETLVFTATYDALPRVLVTGGSATVQRGAGEDYGEGYYSEDATLALTPATAPEGYKFSRWESSNGAGLNGNTFKVTPALRNQTVTLTATYAVDTERPAANPEVTHIGVDEDGAGSKTAVTLGWEPDKTASHTLLGNTFVHHATKMPLGDYAVLGLTEASTTYRLTLLDTNEETNKVSSLVLKRIRPKEDTHYPTGDTYYVGIYETTVGHHKALKVPMENATSSTRGDMYPYVFKDSEGPDTFINALNKAFKIAATRPSVAQIENIAKANTEKDKPFKGAGYRNDPTILEAMIVYEGDDTSTACDTVGSKLPDRYGFYDLWGNALEWLTDNTGHGGRVGYGNDALTKYPSRFTLKFEDSGWSHSGVRGAIRPAVVVPEKIDVRLKDGLSGEQIGPLGVLPGQKVRLAPQVRAGYDFVGWKADKASMAPEPQGDGYWLTTVTEEATFTAEYQEKKPLSLQYKGCLGPETALPGQTITVFAEEAKGTALRKLTVAPESAATVDLTKGTVTFDAEASGDIVITATYEAAKQGYRLRVR